MKTDFYVTGIGVSAGGTEALTSFFKKINPDCETAYVIVQHLATTQKGFLKEVLAKVTSLDITEVNEKVKIEKKHIYIIPPQYFLLFTDGHLSLETRDPEVKINNAIDVFFNTLADKLKEKAVGIILSGMGTDGSRGVQNIKEKGGMVMVQSPELCLV